MSNFNKKPTRILSTGAVVPILDTSDIVQVTGTGKAVVMSQDAITKAISSITLASLGGLSTSGTAFNSARFNNNFPSYYLDARNFTNMPTSIENANKAFANSKGDTLIGIAGLNGIFGNFSSQVVSGTWNGVLTLSFSDSTTTRFVFIFTRVSGSGTHTLFTGTNNTGFTGMVAMMTSLHVTGDTQTQRSTITSFNQGTFDNPPTFSMAHNDGQLVNVLFIGQVYTKN